MNKVIYKLSDGTTTTSYEVASKAKDEGKSYEVTFEWEDLPADKIYDGTPVSKLLKKRG